MSASAGAGARAPCYAALVEPWEPLAADWTGWRGRRCAGRGLRLAAWHKGPLTESRGVRENDGAGGVYPEPTLTHHLQDRKASVSNMVRAERAAACGQLMGLGHHHLPPRPTSRQPLSQHGCRGLAPTAAALPPRVPEAPVLSCRQSSLPVPLREAAAGWHLGDYAEWGPAAGRLGSKVQPGLSAPGQSCRPVPLLRPPEATWTHLQCQSSPSNSISEETQKVWVFNK